MKEDKLQELQSELNELKNRAIKVGYVNKLPRLPKSYGIYSMPPEHTMVGFYKRLTNWENGLLQMEFPGGKPSIKKPKLKIITDVDPITELINKFGVSLTKSN